ncbi:hypothetical protein MJG53_018504 [Ovis ammon polii x Ovis aries]|uniref:Uncharacterized protein n=1 Tax=Ovis ammon polii x Ovis aries TaxID=2918886 RepID=A0ACB9U3Z1_9CETA|nr:hypothetical protein MJG53_018504 [Ovis ammon polii x Ovis aries]
MLQSNRSSFAKAAVVIHRMNPEGSLFAPKMLNGGPEKTCGISERRHPRGKSGECGDSEKMPLDLGHEQMKRTFPRIPLSDRVLEPSLCQAFPNTNCWFLTHMNQPQFRAILRELKLCEKMARLDPKRFAESQPKKHTNWKEKRS